MTDFAKRRTMMVDTQVRPSDVTKFPIIDAMLAVPREDFVPDHLREAAYIGENLDIGQGRTLLEPRTFAKLIDALDIQQHHVVLDLGCGFGYSAAVLAHLCDFVVGVEDNADVVAEAQEILLRHGVDNAAVMEGALAQGAEKSGSYDIIMIEGAVEEVPVALLDQLREGGRIGCLFAEGALGVARIGHKIDGVLNWRHSFNASAPVISDFKKAAAFSF